jgi:hypothetical protein
MPWYAGKGEIRAYLADLNKDSKVLEYCLFQPGMFMDYFASPHKTSKHIHPFQTQIDFSNRRMIVLEGSENAQISLISSQDFCTVVAAAIEYQGEWPVEGGIRGDELTVRELLAIGERIRMCPAPSLQVPLEKQELILVTNARRTAFDRDSTG